MTQKKKPRPIMFLQKTLLIMIAHDMLGMSDAEIAELFNMTRQNVNKLRSLKKLSIT